MALAPHDFRFGSKAEVQRGLRNVRCWGQSGSRFRAAGGLLVANTGNGGLSLNRIIPCVLDADLFVEYRVEECTVGVLGRLRSGGGSGQGAGKGGGFAIC